VKYFNLIILIILILIGVVFATLNPHVVTFNYLVAKQNLPLSLLLIICLIIGVLLGWLLMVVKVARLRIMNRALQKKLQQLGKQVVSQHE